MRVTNIRLKQGTTCELLATVEAPGLLSRKSFPVFYRFPAEFAKAIRVSADPFIAALLLPSMQLGEPLIVEEAASPKLLRALPKIMTFYHNWEPRFKMIEVRTLEQRQNTCPPSKATALFFSCGVDSFYALTELIKSPEKDTFTHLMFVHGIDIRLDDTSLFERTLKAATEVASYYEKKLLLVTTNIREVTDEYVSWNYCCGGALASVALFFSGLFGSIYIASDLGPNEIMPGGFHPDLDPFWSTEITAFIHYCYGIGRIEKAKALADNPMAQRHLRVCWENRNGAYNCGRCSKCVRTMLALHLAGALSNFSFPTSLTPELVAGINYSPDPLVIRHMEYTLNALRRNGDIQLANALSNAMRKTWVRGGLEDLKCEMLKTKSGRRVLRFLAKRLIYPHLSRAGRKMPLATTTNRRRIA